MVTILQSGRAAPGKSNCIKEYMVVPKPGKDLKEVGQECHPGHLLGKGLTSWLSFVVYNCEFVSFPLVSWVRCGT